MKKIFTLALLAFFTQPAFSQTAPDFTITATDGKVHKLYADHLDKGQTVVIEIMFTTCPPCNAFAPYLQPLNQYWGNGQYDVQFFCLSDKNFDTNNSVKNWLNGHGISFPGAGSDGGSLTALQPYTSGQFGGFWGTPTFVVIAPDGKVNFNVGSNNSGQAKADAISTAIAATGALPPPVPVKIEGKVETPIGVPVGKVKLSVFPGYPDVFTTSPDGTFDFTLDLSPGVNYRLFVAKNINPGNGVTTFDMVGITKHILSVAPFQSWYKIIASDVNFSGSVSTFDLVSMRKVILAIDSTFSNGKSWRFIPAGCDSLPVPPSCSVDTVSYFTTNDDMTGLSLVGIKLGDVNYSADADNLAGNEDPDKALLKVFFREKNRRLEAGGKVILLINASDLPAPGESFIKIDLDNKALELFDFKEHAPGCYLDNLTAEKGTTRLEVALPTDPFQEQTLFHLYLRVKKSGRLGDLIGWKK